MECRLMHDRRLNEVHMRIPKKDDTFLLANAGRMFELLSGVDHHPLGCPINEKLHKAIQDLFTDAYNDGIDTIGVSECGLQT
jgi:hypothetical protein